ncbi:319_t:CDS:1, partial [Acaulospora morrowiae]
FGIKKEESGFVTKVFRIVEWVKREAGRLCIEFSTIFFVIAYPWLYIP